MKRLIMCLAAALAACAVLGAAAAETAQPVTAAELDGLLESVRTQALAGEPLNDPADEEAQSEMDALIKSLEERKRAEVYLRIKSLAERMGPMGEFGRNIMTKNPEPMERGRIYEYDQEAADLVMAMQDVLDRQGQVQTPQLAAFDEIVKREPYPVEKKAREIFQRLKQGGITRFLLLFRGSRSRSELVATFMAVLELCRSRAIRLMGGSSSDCTVSCEGELPEELNFEQK